MYTLTTDEAITALDDTARLLTPEGRRVADPRLDPWVQDLDAAALRALYRDMAIVRRMDAEGVALQRQGHLGLWAPAQGQEAIQVGTARACREDDFLFPSYREVGVTIVRGEIDGLPPNDWASVIIATGPLTSPALSTAIAKLTGEDSLAFFDAIAPVIHRDSIDTSIAWFQSRYDKAGPGGTGADYLNCPMTKPEYEAFIDALLAGEKTSFKDWEASTPYFDGCLPVEVMAERGRDTLRYGPMKPVGLDDPRTGRWPYAVVQLRQDNALATLWNMVGFQTKLKHAEQVRVFRTIPGLQNAEFARLGGLHRNTYLNSPKLLDRSLRLKVTPRLRFAGQITGVEGYVESAAMGLLAGRFAAAQALGHETDAPPPTTALGALLDHITGGHLVSDDDERSSARSFQPMNINYGLLPELAQAPTHDQNGAHIKGPERGREKKRAMSRRAIADLTRWLDETATQSADQSI